MKYLDRFKQRMATLQEGYAKGNPAAPTRPLDQMNVPSESVQPVNVVVDLMLACEMKGIPFTNVLHHAETWFKVEWPMVEELIEARKQVAS